MFGRKAKKSRSKIRSQSNISRANSRRRHDVLKTGDTDDYTKMLDAELGRIELESSYKPTLISRVIHHKKKGVTPPSRKRRKA